MVSHQLVYYGFRLSHQKRSPLQSHKDKAYGTLLPGICIRTAASLERIGVESVYRHRRYSKLFFTLISHKIVSKNCKTILPYVCPYMLVSAVSFNDWNFVGGPVDPLRLKISEQQQYLKKKIGEIDFFFAQVGSSTPSLYLDKKKKKAIFNQSDFTAY